MTVTPLQEFVSAALSRQSTSTVSRGTTAAAIAASTSSASGSANTASSSVSVSSAGSGVHTASVTLAQLGSMMEVAQGGIESAQSVLQNLQNLASEAATGGPPEALAELNGEFQQVLSQLNSISSSTSFGGTNLLDGSLSGSQSASEADQNASLPSLSLPNVSAQGLFGNTTPDISTVDGANAALAAISTAQGVVDTGATGVATAQAQVDYATATVASAVENVTASTSVLNEGDFNGADATDASVFAALQNSPALSASVQGDNLPSTIMSLLQS